MIQYIVDRQTGKMYKRQLVDMVEIEFFSELFEIKSPKV